MRLLLHARFNVKSRDSGGGSLKNTLKYLILWAMWPGNELHRNLYAQTTLRIRKMWSKNIGGLCHPVEPVNTVFISGCASVTGFTVLLTPMVSDIVLVAFTLAVN